MEARTGRLLKCFGGSTSWSSGRWPLAPTVRFSPVAGRTRSSGSGRSQARRKKTKLVTLEGSIDMINLVGVQWRWRSAREWPSQWRDEAVGHFDCAQCRCGQWAVPAHDVARRQPGCALYVSADGKRLISSSYHGVLKWWDVASEQCIETLPADVVGNWVKAVAFSADGRLLATGSADQSVQLWRVDENAAQQPMIFSGHVGQVWAVALSSDHRTLASSDDEGMTFIWDTHSGAIVRRLVSDRPYERMNISGIGTQ